MIGVQASRFILYSDFNCPFCYAMHERLQELALMDRIEWRGVQHAPHLPVPMTAWRGRLRAELEHEVAVVQRLSPQLPISRPPGKPNTRAAIERAAAMLSQNHFLGMEFIRRVYRAFWCEGRDLSDPALLQTLLAGESDPLSTLSAGHRATRERWEEAWQATEQGGVPLIVAPDEQMLVGYVPARDILRLFE